MKHGDISQEMKDPTEAALSAIQTRSTFATARRRSARKRQCPTSSHHADGAEANDAWPQAVRTLGGIRRCCSKRN